MVFRSLLFIPGNNKKFLDKSKTLSPDIICYDLEDSVPLNEKENARQMIMNATALDKNQDNSVEKPQMLGKLANTSSQVFVRINSFESGIYDQDLRSTLNSGIDGIVIPKVNSVFELQQIINLIKSLEKERNLEEIKLIPSIESSLGVVNSYSIASFDSRVVALVFGVFDYLYDMKLDYSERDGLEYSYARAKIPVDARAAGISALDSIWQKIDDIDGLKQDAMIAKRLGYSGKTIIHPTHIDSVNEVFFPSQNEIDWANKVMSIVKQFEEQGDKRGALKVDGRMVDAVHFKHAKLILDILKRKQNENKNS
ncbi:MAG: HpcH/HpaI aldolase/citrate lyase family protein [Nitrososphaerales archaeon]